MNDPTRKPAGRPKSSTSELRASRLEAELRANLIKRKQQKRRRTDAAPADKSSDCGKEDT